MRSILIDGLSRPVRLADFELIEAARQGEVGMGGFDVDSENAAFYFNAHKTVSVVDTAAGSNIFTGFVADKDISRGPFSVQNDRQFGTGIVDLNTMLIDDIMTGSSANRPAETDIERVTWLVGTSFLNGMGANIGGSNAVDLEASDYRTQQPLNLLTQAAETSGKLFFVYWDLVANGPKLFYDVATSSNFITSHKISTYLPDGSNSTTHHPVKDSLTRRMDGGRIYSELLYKYDGGSVTVTNTATASNFKSRKTVVYDNTVKTSAMATRKANRYLANAATEEETIMVDVLVNDEDALAFRAGQLMQIKAPHLGLPNFTDRRIVRTSKKPRTDTDEEGYRISMELSLPTSSRWGSRGTPLDQLPDDVIAGSDATIPLVVGSCVTPDPRLFENYDNGAGDAGEVLGGSSSADTVGSWVYYNVAYTDADFPCLLGGGSWRGFEDTAALLEFTAPADDPTSYLGMQTVIDASAINQLGNAYGYHIAIFQGAASTYHWGQGTVVADGPLTGTATIYIPRHAIDWGGSNCVVLIPNWQCDRPVQFCNGFGDFSNPHTDGRANSGSYEDFIFNDICTVSLTPDTSGRAVGIAGVGDVNGSNQTFTLLSWDGTGTVTATINGLAAGSADFTTDTSARTVTFAAAPPANSIVLFTYHAVT